MKPLRPFLVITSLLGLLHAYIGFRLIPELPAGHGIAGAFLVFSCLVMPTGMLARFIFKPILADILNWVGSLMMGFFSSLLVLTVLRDLTLGLSYFLITVAARTELDAVSALAVPSLAALATIIGLFFARRNPPVIQVDVPLTNLPLALHGFLIAQISDPRLRERLAQKDVAMVADPAPDLQQWLTRNAASAIVVRPDRYVLGAATTIQEMDALAAAI